jgi:hypothetical protein
MQQIPDAKREATRRRALTAATEVTRLQGKPGGIIRASELRHALDAAAEADPHLAVMLAAVVWLDRYGSQGAPDRLRALSVALANTPTGEGSGQ